MKKATSITFIFLAITFATAQSSFEGILEFSTTTKATQEASEVKWHSKDGSNRLDLSGVMEGGNYSMTLLFRKGDPMMYLFSGEGESKTLFTVPQDSVGDAANHKGARVTKVEGKKNIAGYDCYLVKIETPEGITECWVSNEVAIGAENFPPSLRSKGVLGTLRKNGISGIPLDVISRDGDGEIAFSFSIKKITAQTLDAGLFVVPSGYKDGEEWIKQSIKVE